MLPDELLADFLQTYGVDLWATDWDGLADGEAARLGALAYQLPRDGRVWRALDPAGANGPELRMLRRMELNQRRWHWAHTKDAGRGAGEPEPVLLDGEEEAVEQEQERQRREASDVADAYGLTI